MSDFESNFSLLIPFQPPLWDLHVKTLSVNHFFPPPQQSSFFNYWWKKPLKKDETALVGPKKKNSKASDKLFWDEFCYMKSCLTILGNIKLWSRKSSKQKKNIAEDLRRFRRNASSFIFVGKAFTPNERRIFLIKLPGNLWSMKLNKNWGSQFFFYFWEIRLKIHWNINIFKNFQVFEVSSNYYWIFYIFMSKSFSRAVIDSILEELTSS